MLGGCWRRVVEYVVAVDRGRVVVYIVAGGSNRVVV